MSSETENYFIFIFSELFILNRLIIKITLKTKQDLLMYSCLILGVGGFLII